MPDMHVVQQQIAGYLDTPEARQISIIGDRQFNVEPLARGEYNLNYLLSSLSDAIKLVFRVNIGTQINRNDQIVYEYKALKLLKKSGVTPRPFWNAIAPIIDAFNIPALAARCASRSPPC